MSDHVTFYDDKDAWPEIMSAGRRGGRFLQMVRGEGDAVMQQQADMFAAEAFMCDVTGGRPHPLGVEVIRRGTFSFMPPRRP